jgi:hypothetical protein
MTGESVRLVDVPTANSILFSDSVFVTSGGAVVQAAPNSVFSNVNLQVATLVVGNTSTPISSTMNVVAGSLWFDSSYLYVATSNNTIMRVALSSF